MMSEEMSDLVPSPAIEALEIPGQGEATDGARQTESRNPELDRFWVAVKRLPKYLMLVADMARDPEVPASAKTALVVGGVYAISPVDLIPGIIPVAGQLDDMVVLLLAIRTAVHACPPDVAARHLERAGLDKNVFDDDVKAVKDAAIWLAGKGLRATRILIERGGKAANAFWREHIRPMMTAD